MEELNIDNAYITNVKKCGRNEKCRCGSGVKYKKCCLIDPKIYHSGGCIHIPVSKHATLETLKKSITISYGFPPSKESDREGKIFLPVYPGKSIATRDFLRERVVRREHPDRYPLYHGRPH